MRQSFKSLYCQHYACALEDYDRRLFRSCLHRHALPFASILRRFRPAFFREDLDFIRDVGAASSRSEVICELNRFYGRNMRDRNWMRRLFGLRLSGKRVLRIYRQLLREARHDARLAQEAEVSAAPGEV